MAFRTLAVALVVAGLGIVACARETTPVPAACATMPQAPAWDPATGDGLRTIVDYAGTLAWEAIDHPTGDRRPLTVIVQRGAQPADNRYQLANQSPEGTAWGIAPQRCAHLFDVGNLGPGGATEGLGEVVAYIDSPRPYLKPPRELEGQLPDCTAAPGRCRIVIPAGRVYVWIDSLTPDGGRALLIPANAASPAAIVSARVNYLPNPDGVGVRSFPEARWLFDPDDDDAWVSCAKTGCCEVELTPGG